MSNTKKIVALLPLLGATLALSAGFATSANADEDRGWSFSGSDIFNTRNAANPGKINTGNVKKLALKWSIVTHGDVSATPTVERNGSSTTVYAVDWGGYLYSIDGNTGNINWSHQISDYNGGTPTASRTSPTIVGQNLIIGDQGGLNFNGSALLNNGLTASVMVINKTTGNLVWRQVVSTHPYSVITSSPVSDGKRIYVGISSLEENAGFNPYYPGFSFRGSVVALRADTGAKVWEFVTVPQGYTGGSVWGSNPVLDTARGNLYVGTGNNYSVPAGVGPGANPVAPTDYFDSVLALELNTGHLKWAHSMQAHDTWDVASWVFHVPGLGPDYDFGSAPNLYTTRINGHLVQILGAGEKSGIYWALDPNTGATIWSTQAGPGGTGGGIEWGSAVDGNRVYCAISNSDSQLTPLGTYAGEWVGLDAATGSIQWQTADPLGGHDFGAVTIANDVVFAGSAGQTPGEAPPTGTPGGFFALDAKNGNILWSYPADGSVNCGASVVNGVVYWGSGYSHLNNGFGISGTPKLYAFAIP